MDERRGFKQLLAWQRADELASCVFRLSSDIAKSDRWLASQIVRAGISVPANIAEGYGRGSLGDYLRFLDIARGSLSELEYYLHFLAKEALASESQAAEAQTLLDQTGRLLTRLWQSLKAKNAGTWDHTGSPGEIHEEYAIYEVDV